MTSRRSVLQLLGTASLGMLPVPGFSTNGDQRLLADPEQLLTAYQRLSGSLDDRLIIWWMSGTRYGIVGARSTALYGMEVGMFHRWYQQADGTYKAAFYELTYYTELHTGNLLREFSNPYTGATDKVRHVRLGPEIRTLTTAGLSGPDNPMVHDYHSSLGPALTHADRLWIPTSVAATIKFPKPSAPQIALNIYTTVQGKLSDALDKKQPTAPCTFEFHNVLKWEPWMQMGSHPGHMMSIASGRKLYATDELPASYLAMARELHAKYITDPATTLESYSARYL